ncbi:MAG: hypothetical protein PHP70_00255 [Gallionella sp.]|nr:hypothetical protein [Gallionella sp.]
MEITTIGIDLAKIVFQLRGGDKRCNVPLATFDHRLVPGSWGVPLMLAPLFSSLWSWRTMIAAEQYDVESTYVPVSSRFGLMLHL